MDDATATPELAPLIDRLQDAEYDVTEPLAGVLHVTGRFSNPERIALKAAADADEQPVAIWATGHHDDWALVCWQRPDLVTITQKGPTPQRWRHRTLPATLKPDAQTFLEGASSPFDIVTRPKHQPTDAARAILDRFAITEPTPPGWVPPVTATPAEVPTVKKTTVPAGGTRRTTATRTPKPKPAPKPAKPQPTVAVCPTCFMALPATGVCDSCG